MMKSYTLILVLHYFMYGLMLVLCMVFLQLSGSTFVELILLLWIGWYYTRKLCASTELGPVWRATSLTAHFILVRAVVVYSAAFCPLPLAKMIQIKGKHGVFDGGEVKPNESSKLLSRLW